MADMKGSTAHLSYFITDVKSVNDSVCHNEQSFVLDFQPAEKNVVIIWNKAAIVPVSVINVTTCCHSLVESLDAAGHFKSLWLRDLFPHLTK